MKCVMDVDSVLIPVAMIDASLRRDMALVFTKELAMKSLNGFDVLMNRRIERRVGKEGADERLCN